MHFYWTAADTAAALLAAGGSMLGLYLGTLAERLLSRRNG
jgi:hypothetical protein